MSRRRQRSRSPDPIIARPSTLPTELGGGPAHPTATLQNALSKRSKRRENQNPTNSSSIHNPSRGNQNEVDTNSVSRGDKSKAKSLNSKIRNATHQSTETLSSTRTAVQGRRDRDRSLTHGEPGRSSKPASPVELIETDDDPQFTGPIAIAQYMRLQNEVEKLREVGCNHLAIDTTYFGFTHSHSNTNGRRRQSTNKARLSMN